MSITALPTPPTRTDPANFATRADAFMAALPTFATEANALQADVNAKQVATSTSAAEAAVSLAETQLASEAALDAANFKGYWNTLTGALNKPASVIHSGKFWILLNNLANVTTSQPGVSADWAESLQDGIVTTQKLADLAVTAAKLAAGAVTSSKLADGAATGAKLGADVVATSGNQSIAGVKTFGSFPILPSTTGVFIKADSSAVAFTKTGNGTASVKAGTLVDVGGKMIAFAADTAITMPTLTAGNDYAIWVNPDASIQATSSFTSPPVTGSRKIGGFHYAPGGHSGSSGGGNSTPQINAYSMWDLKFRPACPDPRGMALVADGFWSDIYLLGVDHLTNGTSKYNVTIADGSSPPKIPTKFGGNGSNAYGSLTWWEATEVLRHHGKRAPTYSEFAALAYGTTEASSIGTDPGSTTWNATYISKWGMAQSSGNLWIWGDEFGGGAAAAGWTANTGGRGSTYQMENAVLFGGYWDDTSISGSRCSGWTSSPANSSNNIGARGVCDHLQLD